MIMEMLEEQPPISSECRIPADTSDAVIGPVPSFWPPADSPPLPSLLDFPSPGERIDDFELIRVLGNGAFGRVYLARQISLDRQVALKVTADCGSEARTLAALEHDHIVQIYSERVVAERGLRLLCMQYVPGDTLEGILQELERHLHAPRNGRSILAAVDSKCLDVSAFSAGALRERIVLAGSDCAGAVCWLGARLAEALDSAHAQGVLHCDIKPANILIHPSGRPYLADFSLSMKSHRRGDARPERFGGSLDYMAPEHLEAFAAKDLSLLETVDSRSDIYSLGVVLFELASGRRPFARIRIQEGRDPALQEAIRQRRLGPPSIRHLAPDLPESLDHVLRRCLEPDPERRYPTAADLAADLDACRHPGSDFASLSRQTPNH